MVTDLSAVDARPGRLTPQTTQQWNRELLDLQQLGPEAVPAIQEWFARNEDVRFDASPGANALGEPSLRIAFLKLLSDVPSAASLALQAQVLQTTTDPAEIALVARQLEAQEPGQYRKMIIDAATAALDMAHSGKLPGRDTRPLIETLDKYQSSAPANAPQNSPVPHP